MRNELEIIETIERYLDGSLAAEERLAFEKQLAEEPELQEAVRLQRNILSGIERVSWKKHIVKARGRYWRGRFLKGGSLGLGGAIIVAVAIWTLHSRAFVNASTRANLSSSVTPASIGRDTAGRGTDSGVSRADSGAGGAVRTIVGSSTVGGVAARSGSVSGVKGAKDTAVAISTPAENDAERALPAQNFRIDAMKDTVLETEGGILLSIPAGSFRQSNGRIGTGNIDVVVREALTPGAIMRAGLSTVSGGTVLETGGMFFVDASKEGKALELDSVRGLYARIPTDTVRPGMQLYTGNRAANGMIDWADPRPLEHDLTPVDIHSLDFYPPGFLDSLAHWGYDSHNKHFTDSLYYSFAQFFAPGDDERYTGVVTPAETVPADKQSPVWNTDTVARSVSNSKLRATSSIPCGLSPARIRAIWNRTFQNTLISTTEFEERLPWIHRSDDESVLSLYVTNLDKPLYLIDSLAARSLKDKNASLSQRFKSFYLRHDGRVNISSRQLDALRIYYEEKVRIFTQAIAKTERAFWDKQAALDREADRRRQEHESDSAARENRNFKEELEINLKNICRQLGFDPRIVTRPPAKNTYKVRLNVLGWCNIDRATRNRISFTVTDEQTNQTAHTDYQFLSLRVAYFQRYDRLYVYLLPDQLSSFMRLPGMDGSYTGSLNAAMHYDLVCIGYKGEQAFYYYQKGLVSGNHSPVALDSIRKEELERTLNIVASRTQAADLQRENAYFQFETRDWQRREMVSLISELQCRVMRKFFTCMVLRVNRCRVIY